LAVIVVAETAFVLLFPAVGASFRASQLRGREDTLREMLLADFKYVLCRRVVNDDFRLEGEDGLLSIETARGIARKWDLRQVILKQRNDEPLPHDVVDVLEEGGFRVEPTTEPYGEARIKVERILRFSDDR
jgi:hypothetical protein